MRKPLPRPTPSELEILSVLWSRGPSTVRDVHDCLAAGRPMGYTTVLKLLQIMAEKGLVTRDERERAHVYAARLAEADTQRQLVKDLVERAFGGSAEKLVLQALRSKRATSDELERIRKMVDELSAKREGETR